ncbi:sigma-70 family RNA polymerase sigma factor [Eisenibacter elegans]|uniref:RNA polymerase sigma factor n=1 Tax=Eisenibacter elegans TaxID=997 RepID=UPI00041AD3F9
MALFDKIKDAGLIERIKRGDETALDLVYQKNYRTIVRMIMRNSGTEDEAKDIYQEAVIIFWQKALQSDFVLSSKISTYLYAICKNLWRKELERKSRLKDDAEADGEELIDFESEERQTIIHQCINSLGKTCKEVLTYYYFDGLSMQDIAEKLGFANADTAKTKKYKCKKQLYDLVKSKYKATDFLD